MDNPTRPAQTNEAPLTAELTLATIALRADPYAAVLDRLRLDFCCRGGRTLAQACADAGLAVEPVLAELRAGAAARDASTLGVEAIEWIERPLPELIDFIVDTHHAYTRAAIARITPLLAKVAGKHGDRHPELARVSATFGELAADMGPHMLREERVLFPYLRALAGPGGAPPPPFVTVRNPVRMMMVEHDTAGAQLADLSATTSDFKPPAGACPSYKASYAALAELRLDLVKHVSLENNVLFPRAVALEDQRGGPRHSHR
jgi:regulator of cell morphogenesis and NO signaling